MKGRRIRTVEQLKKLADNRRSVIDPFRDGHHKPAVFVLNMSCSLVLAKIRSGLYEYRAKG